MGGMVLNGSPVIEWVEWNYKCFIQLDFSLKEEGICWGWSNLECKVLPKHCRCCIQEGNPS